MGTQVETHTHTQDQADSAKHANAVSNLGQHCLSLSCPLESKVLRLNFSRVFLLNVTAAEETIEINTLRRDN